MEQNYYLVTEAEYKEMINCLEIALEAGYSDIVAKLCETTAALNAIDSILNIVKKDQIFRKKEV